MITRIGTYLPRWEGSKGGRLAGPDEDAVTMAVAAGLAALGDDAGSVSSVVLVYKNQKGTRTAEFMELSAAGRVARVVANYSA